MTGPRRPLVLMVEDSEPVRDAFTILLEESGYGVIGVGDGQAALDAASLHAPDLVLLDLGLPGMDGIQVIRALRDNPRLAGVPILALTGRDDEATRQACSSAGCSAFLVKPLPTQQLLRAVAEHLSQTS